jgi:hypothetical protein
VARCHGGGEELENLALACRYCNLHKGPNLAGLDPITTELTRLYNPRTDPWEEHFRVAFGVVHGLTAIGRCSVHVLTMNNERRIQLRLVLEQLEGAAWWK